MLVTFRFQATGDDEGYLVTRTFDDERRDDELLGKVVPHQTLGRGYGTKSRMSLRHVTQWEATVAGIGLDNHDERALRRELKRWKVTRNAAAQVLVDAYAATGVAPIPAPIAT
jgi:hypothetical protein